MSIEQIQFDDVKYSPTVGNVLLQPTTPTLQYPNSIIPLGRTLILTFDILEEDFQYLHATIRHCNADWTPSALNNLEFLNEYNEFPINDYQFSQNTSIPYVNYRIEIPAVTKSGNYLVVVTDDEEKLILSRRFMVFEQLTSIAAEIVRSTAIPVRNTHHQIDFELRYGNLEISNPYNDIKPVILQNHNWSLANSGLKPTGIRIDQGYIEYKHFNQENNFAALNEFRFFDIRSLSYKGQNVEHVGRSQRGIEVELQPQFSRSSQPYSEEFQEDLNGNFFLENRDLNESNIQSEYVWVHFKLNNEMARENVFVAGKFNQWKLHPANQLQYDSVNNFYSGSILLKQGFYNYAFFSTYKGTEPFHQFEGSHFQTTNEYEILVYYRSPGTIYDRLVGYQRIK